MPLLILFRFLWAPFGRQRPSGGKSNLFSRRQRVSFILQKHIFLLKIQQKTPSMSQKGHRGREQTRGTTSVYRLRGLIGYKHTRSAVLGTPSAAYHPPGLRGAAPDGNWDAVSFLPRTTRQFSEKEGHSTLLHVLHRCNLYCHHFITFNRCCKCTDKTRYSFPALKNSSQCQSVLSFLRTTAKPPERRLCCCDRRRIGIRKSKSVHSASAFPSARQASSAASSGASQQITLSTARFTPASSQFFSQDRIHSPSPQP